VVHAKDFLRKGFLNHHPTGLAPSVTPREAKDVGVARLPPPPHSKM